MEPLESCQALLLLSGEKSVRCGADVGIWAEVNNPKKTIFAGCTKGHSVEDIRRDINLMPFEGVPAAS